MREAEKLSCSAVFTKSKKQPMSETCSARKCTAREILFYSLGLQPMMSKFTPRCPEMREKRHQVIEQAQSILTEKWGIAGDPDRLIRPRCHNKTDTLEGIETEVVNFPTHVHRADDQMQSYPKAHVNSTQKAYVSSATTTARTSITNTSCTPVQMQIPGWWKALCCPLFDYTHGYWL